MLRFVAFSASRVGGLASYLEALASSEQSQSPGAKASPKRRRLHILYLLNDLLHHCKYHLGNATTFATVSGSLQSHIVNLVGHAATCDRQKNPRHHGRLDALLDLWSEQGYFHPELITKLREVVTTSATTGVAPSSNSVANEPTQTKKPGKDVPFVMPSTHGDSSTPWCDIASGNLFPHIIPNSNLPLQPSDTKPIHLLAGPADGKSVDVLKGFCIQVDNAVDLGDPKNEWRKDADGLGRSVTGERYHAWTLGFSQQAKTSEDTSSESLSNHGSRTPKRRRYSDSSISQSESESPRRSMSRSNIPNVHRRRDSRSRSPVSRESSYTPREPFNSHFPPPHQPQHAPIPFPRAHNQSGQYPNPHMAHNAGYAHQPGSHYGNWSAQQMPNMPFPPPGPGFPPSAFPPPYHHQPSSTHMPRGQGQGQGQAMPPGQPRFPPPYSGGQQGGAWRPSQGGRRW